jgi:hypothetical protein
MRARISIESERDSFLFKEYSQISGDFLLIIGNIQESPDKSGKVIDNN